MGWIHVVELPHHCELPPYDETYKYGEGSIWQCDTCGDRWKIVSMLNDVPVLFRMDEESE